MKKETLEEAAESYNDDFQIKGGSKAPHIKNQHIMNHFIAGAKWQQEKSNINALDFEIDSLKREIKLLKHEQERSYSEEEVKQAFKVGFSIGYGSDVHAIDEKNRTCDEWFEQFSKLKNG